jgi:ribosomal protein L29
VVTIKKKSSAQAESQAAAQPHASGHHTPMPDESSDAVTDCAFTEQVDSAETPKTPGLGETLRSGLMGRGKDLLSGEAGAVGTAAAIVVGAALIEVELIPGLLIGAGAILLGKLFPELSGYVRPMIKGVVRAGFSASQKAREVMAEASEQVQDLVAEVKQEQAQEQAQDKEQEQKKPARKKSVRTKVAATDSALPAL